MSYARTLALSALLAVTAPSGCAPPAEPDEVSRPATADRVVYLTSFGQSGRDAYVYVAVVKGFFADQGIEVDIRPGTGAGGLRLLAAGQADFAAVDFAGGLLQVARHDLDVKAVALIHQRSLAAIVALAGSGIFGPKDLNGRTLAGAPDLVAQLLFPAYARQAGLDPAAVTVVSASPAQLLDLLAARRVDAISQFAPSVARVAAATGRSPVVLPYAEVLPDLPGDALWAAGRLTRDRPDLVRRFRTALLRGLAYAVSSPDEAGRILAGIVPGVDRGEAAAELALLRPHVQPLGAVDPARIGRTITLLRDCGAIPTVTPDRLVAFDLTPAGPTGRTTLQPASCARASLNTAACPRRAPAAT